MVASGFKSQFTKLIVAKGKKDRYEEQLREEIREPSTSSLTESDIATSFESEQLSSEIGSESSSSRTDEKKPKIDIVEDNNAADRKLTMRRLDTTNLLAESYGNKSGSPKAFKNKLTDKVMAKEESKRTSSEDSMVPFKIKTKRKLTTKKSIVDKRISKMLTQYKKNTSEIKKLGAMQLTSMKTVRFKE